MRLLPLSGLAGSVMFLALAVSPQEADAQAPAAEPRGTIVATPQEKDRADTIKGPSAPAVAVIPPAQRDAAPALQSGTINPPGVMPKRAY